MTKRKVWVWSEKWATRIVVEKHSDAFVAYGLDVPGIVVGEGDTYDEALADVESAIKFHIETFGLNPRNRSAFHLRP